MIKAIKFPLLLAAAMFATGTIFAADINGSIGFAGTVSLNTSSAATATAVTGWHFAGTTGSPYVAAADGDFAGALGMSATFAAPWSFNSGPLSTFWTVDGFTFDLLSSSITSQGVGQNGNGFVIVNGMGTVSGNGFTPTPGTWSFTTQDPSAGAVFSFSASDAVPEPSIGALIAGGGLLLGAALRARSRKLRASR